jgi:hypothetical protein
VEILQANSKCLLDTQKLPLLIPTTANPSTCPSSKKSRSGKKKARAPNYRQVMDQIAQIWKKRNEMPDPKLANLQVQ